jgi:hypothetical protein
LRQGDKGIGEVGHAGLALVHGGDGVQLAKAGVGELFIGESAGNDADDAAAGGKRAIGEGAHEPDVAAAIDEGDGLPSEEPAEGGGGLGILGMQAGAGAAIDAEGSEVHFF